MNNINFIGITSASGGSGCSCCAIALSRILTQLNNQRVLCIGLDSLSAKMAPAGIERKSSKRMLTRLISGVNDLNELVNVCISRDDFGVFYFADNNFYNPLFFLTSENLQELLLSLSESNMFDSVVLDIPYSKPCSEQICSYCEDLILCNGYLPSQISINEKLLEHLLTCFNELSEKPRLLMFSPSYDSDSFLDDDIDIHGQFGAEVRVIASQFFKEK